MDKLAVALNETLKKTNIFSMLSDYGRRMYVPKGIIVQGAEAKKKANKFNATIGVALNHGKIMYIPGMKKQFADTMDPSEIFSYAPMGGVAALRQTWLDDMIVKNPLLKGKTVSLPVVCSGLTNALSVTASLFLDRGDTVVMPEFYWENYNLIYTEQVQANIKTFANFDGESFNVNGLDEAISSSNQDKVVVVLNFPNNPTGYTPTNKESDEIACVLKKHADSGKKLVVITDDAYFGLFFDKDVCRQSLFAKICDISENILAVKCDAATKEEMAWGLRVAFITYGFKGCTEETLNVLVQKTMGTIRGTLSNCSMSGQNIILKSMQEPTYIQDRQAGVDVICKRYNKFKECLNKHKNETCLKPYPFNSGYFMSFNTKCDAEELRNLLLDEYGTGTIRLGDHLLRIAFSSVDEENIDALVDTVYTAASRLS